MPTPVATPVPVVMVFSWPNGLWSLLLVLLLGVAMWAKLQRLRMEIRALAEALPNIGSEFIRRELLEVKKDMDQVIVRLKLCENRQGFNGDDP